MKWEKGLLVSIGFVVGGLSYGSLPEIVNLGPSSDLAEAFLPALKIKSIFMPKVEPYYIETFYHGYFPSESEGEGLQVQCSTSDTTGYNFNGCDLSKAASKDTKAPHLTVEDLIFAQPKLSAVEWDESFKTVKWSLPSQAPLAQAFYLALPFDLKQTSQGKKVKHGLFQVDGAKGYLVECSKFPVQIPTGPVQGCGRVCPDYSPLLKNEIFHGCEITLTSPQEVDAPLITIEDLVKAQVPKN